MYATRHTAITLVVINSERLEGRSTSSHVFHTAGGTLGSADNDDWLMQDHAGCIQPGHAQLQHHEGRFCLLDRSGQTFINRATMPIGRDRRVALRDGDELQVGGYRLRVHLGDRQMAQPGALPLAALIDEEHYPDPLDALGRSSGVSQSDPLNALADPDSSETPLTEVLDGTWEEVSPARDDATCSVWSGSQTVLDTPGIQRREELSMDRNREMDDLLLDELERSVGEQLEERWQEPGPVAAGHVGADPLLRAMGVELNFRDSTEQQAFLQEAGNTLRVAIEGLQALHRVQEEGRCSLRDRRLQPIEDNPLRLGQSYADTVATMFSANRSPVHLSAPSAVAECLGHQGQQQAAVEAAISEALQAILSAFAPDALLKRFHAYRGADNRIEDEDSWAWSMYRHYFKELDSGRQQGFEKLFWEVFEQAYDQSVRRQQREEA